MGLGSNRIDSKYVCKIAYIALVVAVLAAIYSASLRDLFHEWWNFPEQSQGLVIVPVALMVAWLRRRSVRAIPATSQLRGLGLVGFACVLHLFGQVAAGLYMSQISFVVVLAGLVWTFLGIGRLRALALPLLLLAAAIPLPSLIYASLSMPLQLLASKAACGVADFAESQFFARETSFIWQVYRSGFGKLAVD